MHRHLKLTFQKQMIKTHMGLKKRASGGFDSCDYTIDELLTIMSLEEKIDYISGINSFCIRSYPKIHLNEVWTTDATAGVRGWDEKVTVFPSPIAMAATFNRSAINNLAKEISKETRYVGASILLAPGVNIHRVPTCGRNFEYFGEDPYLAGEIAKVYIEGCNEIGVITTVKHFACNNSDYDRHKADSIVDERTLFEIYLPAFKKAVDSKTLSVMTSYNLINGKYASENEYLVEEVLRKKWGFKGFVISDWTSVYSTKNPMKHGIDLEMPEGVYFHRDNVLKALENKEINEEDINKKVRNILTVLKKSGVLDRKINDDSYQLHSKDAQDIAYQVALESITLLKNDNNLLPLDKSKIKSVVILGKNRNVIPAGGGSSQIIPRVEMIALEEKLKREGYEVISLDKKWYKKDKLNDIVKNADLVIVKTGFDSIDESEFYDRDYDIDIEEVRTIITANSLNDNTITIINSGGAFNPNWVEKTKTLILSYYLGEKEADALFDIILNKVSPSGKLPFTIAKKLSDYESYKNYYDHYNKFSIKRVMVGQGNPNKRKTHKIKYEEGLLVGYRDFRTNNKEVEFDFGHGLSYTKFEYSSLNIKEENEKVIVNFDIENIGDIEAKETAFIFIHCIDSKVFRVEEELKGFEKVSLKPNEKKTISIELNQDDFKYYDINTHDWQLEPCKFEIRVNSSANSNQLKDIITIK